jgi:hypothetical protein
MGGKSSTSLVERRCARRGVVFVGHTVVDLGGLMWKEDSCRQFGQEGNGRGAAKK